MIYIYIYIITYNAYSFDLLSSNNISKAIKFGYGRTCVHNYTCIAVLYYTLYMSVL